MDNITIRFSDVTFDMEKLKTFLKNNKARESLKPDEVFLFSRKVGKHEAGWQFRLDTRNNNILCSGGPTSTFFGFNAWVSLNVSVQMKAIVEILRHKLEQMDGVTLSKVVHPTVHRVEITNLYRFSSIQEIAQAEIALYSNLVVRYPKKVMLSGASMEVPGMLRVGLNKSQTTLRLYPECVKLESKPVHVSSHSWAAFCAELRSCLRVECIFDKAQLVAAGLNSAEKWNTRDCINKLVDARMIEAGLRGVQAQSHESLDRYLAETPQTKVKELIQEWMRNGFTDVNGTWTAAQKVVKGMGFDLTKPFSQQEHLAHGYQGYFDADRVVKLSDHLRNSSDLFERWWEAPAAL